MTLIFKILETQAYNLAVAVGQFMGAEIDLKDGYIHFSTKEQVAETAAKHFAQRGDLMVMAVDTKHLGVALKWEVSRAGQLFPHLYSPLIMRDILWARPLLWDGLKHVFPAETFL